MATMLDVDVDLQLENVVPNSIPVSEKRSKAAQSGMLRCSLVSRPVCFGPLYLMSQIEQPWQAVTAATVAALATLLLLLARMTFPNKICHKQHYELLSDCVHCRSCLGCCPVVDSVELCKIEDSDSEIAVVPRTYQDES